MATLAELMFQQASQSVSKGPDLAGSFAQGAELAMRAEQIKQQRQQQSMAKEQLELAKWTQLGDHYEKAFKMADGDAKNAFLKNYIPSYINAAGLTDKVNPISLKMMEKSPEVGAYFKSVITEGKKSFSEIQQIMNDPALLAKEFPEISKFKDVRSLEHAQELFRGTVATEGAELSAANKFAVENERKREAQQIQVLAERQEKATTRAETGNVELAKKTAANYAKFLDDGGKSGAERKIQSLREVYDQLINNKVETGTPRVTTAALFGDTGLSIGASTIKEMQDKIRNSISLKGSLDSQFSAAEAAQTYSRSFDPKLSTQMNAKKVLTLLNELESSYKNQMKLFVRHGHPVDDGISDTKQKALTPQQRAAHIELLRRGGK